MTKFEQLLKLEKILSRLDKGEIDYIDLTCDEVFTLEKEYGKDWMDKLGFNDPIFNQ